MQRGLTESLAGRFELHRHYQWSFPECRECFSLGLNEYLYFGGYPGAIPMRKDEARWARYIRDSLIETVLSKDVLLMSPVTKPALLRQTFGLAAAHPAEIVSYQKMLGQLQDAGNTTTLASYLKLLSSAFLTGSLERWSGSKIRQKGSIPKLFVFDNAIVSATGGRSYKAVKADKAAWGRMVENAAGARLYLALQDTGGNLFYWRERQLEVDFVVQAGPRLIALEVKSGAGSSVSNGIGVFTKRHKNAEGVIIADSQKAIGKKIKQVHLRDFFANPLKSIGLE
jgi:predicted AAA+ superfamily ATPase